MERITRLILNDINNEQPYFMLNKQRWYFSDISSDGYNLTMFTNAGYYGGWRVIGIEHDVNDRVILERVKE